MLYIAFERNALMAMEAECFACIERCQTCESASCGR